MGKYSEKFSRKDKVAEWSAKGATWCAEQLWNARSKCSDAQSVANWRNGYDIEKAEKIASLEEANNGLAKVLNEHGIKPKRVRIEYITQDCEYEFPCYDDDCEDCEFWNDEKNSKAFSLYTWEVTNGVLYGITALFNDLNLDVLRVLDEKTGAVLYEYIKGE